MAVAWNDDPPGSEAQIQTNIRAVSEQISNLASRREQPTVAIAQDWHRSVYEHVALPVSYYAGEVRDSDQRYPELIAYEVQVGHIFGVDSSHVPQELDRFEARARAAVVGLDAQIPSNGRPTTPAELQAVLLLAAMLHGEWVRIHPFANGNGRTARLWAIWAALRYGLPPFIRLRPRPAGNSYAAAAFASMTGRHMLMAAVFGEMLNEYLRNGPGDRQRL
jgi:fido (protein-threonine AMPylation protein)